MEKPESPHDESRRIETLRSLKILDTGAEERFDRLTRLAQRMFGVPIALVSLVDEHRQWFKSRAGLTATETPRDVSFCGHAILRDEIFLVPDAQEDERFADNPLVVGDPHVRFYAGCPLKAPDGSKLGTLCLIDRTRREFGSEDLNALRDLAEMAERELAATHLAVIDELTQISNRRGFSELADHALARCRRQGRPSVLLFFDLDGFKEINDRHGHAEGDNALAAFARLLRTTFRESDVIGRHGGDEFVVLTTDVSLDEARTGLGRLEVSVRDRNRASRLPYELAYSVGSIEFNPRQHTCTEDLLRDADKLMYQHKTGRKSFAPPKLAPMPLAAA